MEKNENEKKVPLCDYTTIYLIHFSVNEHLCSISSVFVFFCFECKQGYYAFLHRYKVHQWNMDLGMLTFTLIKLSAFQSSYINLKPP